MVIKADKLLNKSSGRLAMQKAQQEKMVGGGPSNIVLSKKSIKGIGGIKINVIKIEDILKGSLALDKKQLDDKKKATSKKRKEDIETKLETKPNAESGGKVKMPTAPRMGILDFVKNFIGNVLLGYFAVRLIDHLPKIMPILKFLGNAADFIIDIGGKLLNGLVTFIDIGYKAYDATRGFLKSFGGENFAKGFDKFIGAIDTALFLTTALAASMALESLTGGDDAGGGITDMAGNKTAQSAAGKVANVFAKGGQLTGAGTAAVVAGAGLLSSALGEGAFQVRKFAVKPIQKLENDQKNDKNPFTRFGRGVALNMIRPLFGLFQAVGVLLDIVGAPFRYAIELLRYPFLSEEDKVKQAGNLAKFDARIREDFRKALNMLTLGLAFKEKGSFGNIYGNQGAQKEMMGKMAGGGITRGGKSAGRAKRTFGGMKKKQTYKRKIAQKPTQVQIKPGADVGGEDKIFGIFPNPFKAAKKVIDIVNPFNVIKTAGEDLGKTDYFGPILAITSKMILGQKPDQMDYKNVGLGLNLLIAKGVQDGQLKGGIIPAFAEGGLVDPDVLSAIETGGDISSWVANTFRGEIETGAQKTMRLIKENMDKKKAETDPPSDPISDPNVLGSSGGGTADTSLNPYRRAFLDTLAYAEGTGGYPNTGYNTMFTGKQFAGYKDHPRKIQVSGKYRSDAAGRYQFLSTTWDGLGLTDFSPANQDKGALKLLAPHVLTAIDKGDFATAFHGARKTWASLPGAGYGQPEKSMKILVGYANNRVGQYQKGEIGSPTGPGMSVSTSAASGPMGNRQKNAGELGSFIKSLGVARGSGVTEHPKHGGVGNMHRGRGHYEGRAIDIGGYGGKYGRSETKRKGISYIDDQPAILAGINKFTQKTGIKPSLVLHGDNDPGHWDHVHAEYAKGGETLDGPHLAMLGEKGKEIVIDADSAGPAKDMLLAINQAKGYKGVMTAISQYAPYDVMSPQTIIIPSPSAPEEDDDYGDAGGGGGMLVASGGGGDDPFSTLYQGG
jgi:muramidase (phage lysozyme)